MRSQNLILFHASLQEGKVGDSKFSHNLINFCFDLIKYPIQQPNSHFL